MKLYKDVISISYNYETAFEIYNESGEKYLVILSSQDYVFEPIIGKKDGEDWLLTPARDAMAFLESKGIIKVVSQRRGKKGHIKFLTNYKVRFINLYRVSKRRNIDLYKKGPSLFLKGRKGGPLLFLSYSPCGPIWCSNCATTLNIPYPEHSKPRILGAVPFDSPKQKGKVEWKIMVLSPKAVVETPDTPFYLIDPKFREATPLAIEIYPNKKLWKLLPFRKGIKGIIEGNLEEVKDYLKKLWLEPLSNLEDLKDPDWEKERQAIRDLIQKGIELIESLSITKNNKE